MGLGRVKTLGQEALTVRQFGEATVFGHLSAAIRALNEALHLIPRKSRGNHIARIRSNSTFLHSLGHIQTTSVGVACPVSPSADIVREGGHCSSCPIC